ncbi:MAG: hypothetical protein ACRENI_02505 [Gemmatimonadaceae bacterium]
MAHSTANAAVLPEPPRTTAWAALIYGLCVLALAYPLLDGQFLVNPYSDEYIAGYAFREYGAAMLAETGGFPLWNPYLFGGLPFVAAMHGDIFYPTFLLRAVIPTDVAMTLAFVIHTFLAGLFTYRFLRATGLEFHPSVLGGVAYMLSGPIASYAGPGHDGKLYVSALLPLVLWMLIRGVRDGCRWAWGVLALAIGLAVLSPHPQLLQYMLLAAGAFAVYIAAGGTGSRIARALAIRRLVMALGAVLLGGLMGAIQYLPVTRYVDWSPRAGGLRGYEAATSFSMPPEELINTYLPQFSGILDAYWGRNGIHFHSEYLGAAILLIAGAAFFGRAGRTSFLWFWTATLGVSVLWALGGFTPFYQIIYAVVPGTRFFRAPSTILYIVAFATSMLAALGTRRILARAAGPQYLLAWTGAALGIALLATSGALTNLATTLAPAQRYDAAAANEAALIAGAWRSFVFVAVTAGLLLLFTRGALSARVMVWALIAVVGADLWSIARRYWMFSPPASVIYASDPTIEYIKSQPEPGRVLALQTAPSPAVNDPFLNYDALMSHRIRLVLGYHGNELARYQELYAKQQGSRNIGNPAFWRLANVRYLLTNSAESPIPGAELLVGPVENAAGSTVYLYSMPGDNPAAWVTPAILKVADDQAYALVLDPRLGDVLSQVALFDTGAPVQSRQLDSLPPPLDIEATVTRYQPGDIRVELSSPSPPGAALVVSENYYPGWSATSEGRELPIGRVDFSLIGVALPEGTRSITLDFASQLYRTGRTITIVATLLVLALIVGGVILDRRQVRRSDT